MCSLFGIGSLHWAQFTIAIEYHAVFKPAANASQLRMAHRTHTITHAQQYNQNNDDDDASWTIFIDHIIPIAPK